MLKPSDYIQSVKRNYPPFYIDLIFRGYQDRKNWQKFLGFDYCLQDLVVINALWYYRKYHLIDFAQKIAQKLFNSSSFFYSLRKITLKKEKALLKALPEDFSTFCTAYSNYMPTLGIYFICDDIIENKVKESLLKKLAEPKVKELMAILTIPYEDNFQRKEKYDLITSSNLSRHLVHYQWIRSRYGQIIPYTQKDALTSLKELKVNNFRQTYKKEKIKIKEAIKQAHLLLGKKNKHIVDVMQFFIFYRTQRTDIMNMASFFYAHKLKDIAKTKGISYEDLLYCTNSEINGVLPSQKVISARKTGFAFVGDKNGVIILTGHKYRQLFKQFQEDRNIKETLSGRSAFIGRVLGQVKIIKTIIDLKKIKKGDILVTSMTTPEMVPAMKKVAAFVTDEGGITCHAAIISRELKKPCIVGTKIATSALKDDDKVEVDATKGVVRKMTT